jgi:hypothetical protein
MADKRNHTINRAETITGKKDDKVMVTSFSVKPSHPENGETVTIRMSIKNVSGKSLDRIPWQIVKDKSILDFGTRCSLSSGDTFSVSVTWKAKPGNHFFYGDVDPENTLKEPRVKQYNNSPQGIDVTVQK